MSEDSLFDEGDPFDDPAWAKTKKTVRRVKPVREDGFVGCQCVWMRQVLPLVRSKEQLAVALLLYRHHALYRGKPFAFPNGEMDYLGISRNIKYRTLTRLEQAGLIEVERKNGHAVVVTVLCDWRTGLPVTTTQQV